ncbi:SPFH domain-containing protein [Luteipulveratus flavus]|uniref:SPFH/Band 7/PHB domain protein n=1 Tax=Luteipulveratus flavus TaxID=3031728 RepID=A0ABT6C392_9MICO|nr:SPFH domain-containing protein [Luteipulveratus sp. YIM 133296]MDF8262782.1 SPFH/Band 7/PHB domain protein [Luteipulveratus sp. YIM 133296]
MDDVPIGLIALIVLAVLVVIAVIQAIKVIPQAQAAVIERLGRYNRTTEAGVTWLVPFIDRIRSRVDLREQVVSFPPQPVITEDNLTVSIDTVVYFQVTDPKAAVYEIANYILAVEQLTITTLRNVVGGMNLEQALTSRDAINTQLRGVLDEATGKWGLRVSRVELKAIDPPPSIQDSMEKQMRADRDKRAIILTAEGQREAAIKTAEGQKQAAVLTAEGAKQAAILNAEGERQSAILRAEGQRAAQFLTAQGQAKAIEKTFAAIKQGRPTPELLAYQYLQTLPTMARGDANKVWMIPNDFSKSLQEMARAFGAKGDDGVFRYEGPEPESDTSRPGDVDDDVKDWFGSTTADAALAAVRQAEAAAQMPVEEGPLTTPRIRPQAPPVSEPALPPTVEPEDPDTPPPADPAG